MIGTGLAQAITTCVIWIAVAFTAKQAAKHDHLIALLVIAVIATMVIWSN